MLGGSVKKIKTRQMLNDRQLQIANLLLKHMEDRKGKSNIIDSEKYLAENGFNGSETSLVISFLINHYKLIEYFSVNLYGNTEFHIRITPEGNKAIKWGIDKYIKKKEKRPNKRSEIIAMIALVVASIQPGIALKNLIFPENKTENRYYQSENRKVKSSSFTISEELFEKLKDSLKHDAKFLNELKLELKNKTGKNQTPTP